MPAINAFDAYISRMRKSDRNDKTEHSDRGALENLLQALAEEANKDIEVRHEPKRDAEHGAPDYKAL